jgi:hypothetical protein
MGDEGNYRIRQSAPGHIITHNRVTGIQKVIRIMRLVDTKICINYLIEKPTKCKLIYKRHQLFDAIKPTSVPICTIFQHTNREMLIHINPF